ncbi:MAG: ammonia-forming cytochrome c nitrite reductase subunit c552 [Helicobacteraceae bacterium]|jgi:nitrite reductase (cytochrome c-552)|nr:ammonia-forming cytochrome c nitrite reductase subunit c552 [Helicobacteraceae bacterium]
MKKYVALLAVSLMAIVVMGLLATDINAKEGERVAMTNPGLNLEHPSVNSEWSKKFPRQYGSWKKTSESIELEDMLKKWPALAIVWAGYPFSKDYNAPRGHYYAVVDNTNTLRVAAPEINPADPDSPLPAACWTCKSPDVVRLMEDKGDLNYYTGKWNKWGTEVTSPIGCYDCHDKTDASLKMGRKYVNDGLKAAKLPEFKDSTHQVKRDLVCAQCHSEYYFHPTPNGEKTAMAVVFPWKNGLEPEGMLKYYDDPENFPNKQPFADFKNSISGVPIIKAQHPDYELHTTGIHGKKGVSCADCHMPYTQEGATKFSDHQIQSPLKTMDRSCMTCHREDQDKLKAILKEKYDRKETLFKFAVNNLATAHLEMQKARELGATDAELASAVKLIRNGQWRWDYAVASHGGFYHAPDETLFILSKANQDAQAARVELRAVLAKKGAADFQAPDFSTKEKAQAISFAATKWPSYEKLAADKKKFKDEVVPKWLETAKANGLLDPERPKDDRGAWFGHSK